MDTKEKILKYVKEKKAASGRELSEHLGISRQAVNKHLKVLIQEGRVFKEGTTKGVLYRSPASKRFIKGTEVHVQLQTS